MYTHCPSNPFQSIHPISGASIYSYRPSYLFLTVNPSIQSQGLQSILVLINDTLYYPTLLIHSQQVGSGYVRLYNSCNSMNHTCTQVRGVVQQSINCQSIHPISGASICSYRPSYLFLTVNPSIQSQGLLSVL